MLRKRIVCEILHSRKTYHGKRPIECATNAIRHRCSGLRWKRRAEVLDRCGAMLLLLAGCVDVGEERRNVVSTDKCHHSGVVVAFHGGLLLLTIRGFVRWFAAVDCLARHCSCSRPKRAFARLFYAFADRIDLGFREEVAWVKEGWAVTCRTSVPVVKVAIRGNLDACPFLQRSAAKTRGATLAEKRVACRVKAASLCVCLTGWGWL